MSQKFVLLTIFVIMCITNTLFAQKVDTIITVSPSKIKYFKVDTGPVVSGRTFTAFLIDITSSSGSAFIKNIVFTLEGNTVVKHINLFANKQNSMNKYSFMEQTNTPITPNENGEFIFSRGHSRNFLGKGILIQNNHVLTLMVQAKVKTPDEGVQDGMQFNFKIRPMSAFDSHGKPIPVMYKDKASTSRIFTVKDRGAEMPEAKLSVLRSAEIAKPRQILSGSEDEEIFECELRAVNSPVFIKNIKLKVHGNMSVIKHFFFYKRDNYGKRSNISTQLGPPQVPSNAGIVQFDLKQPMLIPQNKSIKLTVDAYIKKDSEGVKHGVQFAVSLEFISAHYDKAPIKVVYENSMRSSTFMVLHTLVRVSLHPGTIQTTTPQPTKRLNLLMITIAARKNKQLSEIAKVRIKKLRIVVSGSARLANIRVYRMDKIQEELKDVLIYGDAHNGHKPTDVIVDFSRVDSQLLTIHQGESINLAFEADIDSTGANGNISRNILLQMRNFDRSHSRQLFWPAGSTFEFEEIYASDAKKSTLNVHWIDNYPKHITPRGITFLNSSNTGIFSNKQNLLISAHQKKDKLILMFNHRSRELQSFTAKDFQIESKSLKIIKQVKCTDNMLIFKTKGIYEPGDSITFLPSIQNDTHLTEEMLFVPIIK